MTEFEVIVYDKNGNKIKTKKQADSINSLKKELVSSGFVVVSINPVEKGFSINLIEKTIKDKDIYQFFRELSILTKSKVKLDKSLQILINSTQNQKLKQKIEDILKQIKAGEEVSAAFEKTRLFNPLIISLIKASEITGDLSTGFENSANYIKFQIQFKNEIKSAMVYPSFLIFSSMLTILIILKFIVPKFFSVFPEAKPENLPTLSKVILYISNSTTLNLAFISAISLLILTIYILKKQNKLSNLYAVGFYIPVLKDLLINLNLSRFFYSMYSMLSSGVEFIKALELSSMTIQSKNLRNTILSTVDEIKKGKSISEAFSTAGILNQSTLAMITVGEESGNLQEILFEIYSTYDENFKNSTKRLLTIMEPLIITVTGVIVGFIVISLILTVITITNVKL